MFLKNLLTFLILNLSVLLDKKSDSSYKKITYEGNIAGLKDVKDILNSINNE